MLLALMATYLFSAHQLTLERTSSQIARLGLHRMELTSTLAKAGEGLVSTAEIGEELSRINEEYFDPAFLESQLIEQRPGWTLVLTLIAPPPIGPAITTSEPDPLIPIQLIVYWYLLASIMVSSIGVVRRKYRR